MARGAHAPADAGHTIESDSSLMDAQSLFFYDHGQPGNDGTSTVRRTTFQSKAISAVDLVFRTLVQSMSYNLQSQECKFNQTK